MVSVPGFLLRRLYVKGSLKNRYVGFEFQLKNMLGSGYAQKIQPLTLDGEQLPIETAYFNLDGTETSFANVSSDSPFTLPMNKTITVSFDGPNLGPGAHKIGMGFDVPGLGTLRFDFNDIVADE